MKTAVLLSGGVDSSVAALKLKEEGHDLRAFYLKIWLEDELAFLGDCPWEEDLSYVRAVCSMLGIPLEIVNMQAEYLNTVVEYTIKELKAGRTPSPDIMCNKNIKFGEFFGKIDDSYEKVASGHYARVVEDNGIYRLGESPDKVKDQTYFLTYLSQAQLSRILFPIGHMTKRELRDAAAAAGLPTSARKDSQGICFLGKIKYNDFIKFHLGEKQGDIIEIETGRKLGRHNGFWFHTIGQRQGLGLSGGPWYVARKDIDENIVFVSRVKYSEAEPKDEFHVGEINWIGPEPAGNTLKVKLRHGPNKYGCRIEPDGAGILKVHLDEKDQGIAPGQFAIFYDGGYCLGGGVILAGKP